MVVRRCREWLVTHQILLSFKSLDSVGSLRLTPIIELIGPNSTMVVMVMNPTDSPLVQRPDSLVLRYSEKGVCHTTILCLSAQLVKCLTLNLQSGLGCVKREGACEGEEEEEG